MSTSTRVASVFFAALLIVGLAVYRDYGISWDEIPTREFGMMYVDGAITNRPALDSLRAAKGPAFERFGPLFEIILVRAEKLVSPTQPADAFYLRHLLTFLTWYVGVVLFWLFCRRRFSPTIALLATVGLVASPPLFSHAFYNTKDVSFLTTFVAAMLTLDVLLAHPTRRSILLHGVTTAILLGTRVIGLFAMMLTGAAAIARRPTRRTLLELVGYGAIVALLLPVVWPVLRIDPFGIIKDAVVGSASNPYLKTNLFRGQQIPASDLPWDYMPTWIMLTTPVVLVALFLVGTQRVIVSAIERPREYLLGAAQRDVIVFCWFFAPVMGTVVLRPVMYDAWRHFFFVYPALVYLAAVGMEAITAWVASRVADEKQRVSRIGMVAAFLVALAPAGVFMVRNHPYQHVYFNWLAGRDMAEVKRRYELDYWGLSYREALEWIVRSDPSPAIRVHVANYPGLVNSLMLDARDRARIRYVPSPVEAEYFVTNYRYHPEPYPYTNEVFSVRVGNASVASVFRLR